VAAAAEKAEARIAAEKTNYAQLLLDEKDRTQRRLGASLADRCLRSNCRRALRLWWRRGRMAGAAERIGCTAPVRRGWYAFCRVPGEAAVRAAAADELVRLGGVAATTLRSVRVAAVLAQWRRAHAVQCIVRRCLGSAMEHLQIHRTQTAVLALRAAAAQAAVVADLGFKTAAVHCKRSWRALVYWRGAAKTAAAQAAAVTDFGTKTLAIHRKRSWRALVSWRGVAVTTRALRTAVVQGLTNNRRRNLARAVAAFRTERVSRRAAAHAHLCASRGACARSIYKWRAHSQGVLARCVARAEISSATGTRAQVHCTITSLVTWLINPCGLVRINRLITR